MQVEVSRVVRNLVLAESCHDVAFCHRSGVTGLLLYRIRCEACPVQGLYVMSDERLSRGTTACSADCPVHI
jgi:hypothetical protein